MPKKWQEKKNMQLLAQAIRVYESNRHPGLSKVKTRGEVNISTRKIYRQKGTGLARHGAKSAPIFVGGGIAHGPKGIKRELSLPRILKNKALMMALSLKAQEGRLFIIDKINGLEKTQQAKNLINKIIAKEKILNKNPKIIISLSKENKKVEIALRNLRHVLLIPFRNLNAYNVFFTGMLLVDKEALGEDKKADPKKAIDKKELVDKVKIGKNKVTSKNLKDTKKSKAK
ncbi:50S ribosomal protein L4 [Candidatus Woesebacteria bacterium RBG_16_34_12]|uniref:Large ribosomal subunit protein uL4 n=1 Tax=Candidatus Woesebacteria bacterium RBG_16_34_12 TaxID=1802480 RepID=A0A1F7X9A3_9BACT|nr:MAG: 50S ribosomal protein L4 [Candidatus Woesebacteria bacterium RBG_16_34_12]